jgi:hypothetical protein
VAYLALGTDREHYWDFNRCAVAKIRIHLDNKLDLRVKNRIAMLIESICHCPAAEEYMLPSIIYEAT